MNKKIHINLPANLHKKLRIKCASLGISIQKYVENLIESKLKKPAKKKNEY